MSCPGFRNAHMKSSIHPLRDSTWGTYKRIQYIDLALYSSWYQYVHPPVWVHACGAAGDPNSAPEIEFLAGHTFTRTLVDAVTAIPTTPVRPPLLCPWSIRRAAHASRSDEAWAFVQNTQTDISIWFLATRTEPESTFQTDTRTTPAIRPYARSSRYRTHLG